MVARADVVADGGNTGPGASARSRILVRVEEAGERVTFRGRVCGGRSLRRGEVGIRWGRGRMIGCVCGSGLVKMAGSKGRVEADLGDSDGRGFRRGGRVVMVAAGVGEARGGYHVFAFKAAAVDARCKRADAIPR